MSTPFDRLEESVAQGEVAPATDTTATITTESLEAAPESPATASVVEPTGSDAPEKPDEFDYQGTEDEVELKTKHGEGAGWKAFNRLHPIAKGVGGVPNLRTAADLYKQHGSQTLNVGAQIAQPFLDLEAPIQQVAEQLFTVSPSRGKELRDHLYAQTAREFPDFTFQWMLGDENVTVAEVQEALAEYRQYRQSDTPTDDLADLSPELRQEIIELRTLKGEIPGIKEELQANRTEKQQSLAQTQADEVKKIGTDLYGEVWGSVLAERIKPLNIEIKDTDTPTVQGLKQALNNALSQEAIEAEFDRSEENQKLVAKALGFAGRRERHNAFAMKEALGTAAHLAAHNVIESDKVKHLLASLRRELEAHTQPRNPTVRTELVNGQTASLPATDIYAPARGKGREAIWDAVEASVPAGRVTRAGQPART